MLGTVLVFVSATHKLVWFPLYYLTFLRSEYRPPHPRSWLVGWRVEYGTLGHCFSRQQLTGTVVVWSLGVEDCWQHLTIKEF